MPKRKLRPKASASPNADALPQSRVRVKPTPRLNNRYRPRFETPTVIPEQKRDFGYNMPMKYTNSYPGLWSDLLTITNTFDQSENMRRIFRDFREFCIGKKLLDIFRGFTDVHQRLEFTETVISRCKEMWLETPTFEKQLTWFYLLCYMYLYQPETLLTFSELGAKIRIGVDEYGAISRFRSQASIQNIPDVSMLFDVLIDEHAFLHCWSAQPHGVDKCFMEYFAEDTEKSDFLNKTLTCPRLVHSLRKLKTEANETLSEYCAAKEALLSVESRDNTRKDLVESLSSIGTNFTDELFSCLSTNSQVTSSSVTAEAGLSKKEQSLTGPSKPELSLAGPSKPEQSIAGPSKKRFK